MKVNDWLDERMDFWKSTQGALKKLEENQKLLGDWLLALAAYNAGLGGIRKAMKDTGLEDYWNLCEMRALKTETIHYLPKFLAVSYILSNPRRFGLDFSWVEDPRWERIPLERAVDLRLLARETGVDESLLKAANRELRYHISPAGGGYQLKVPAGDKEKVAAVLSQRSLPLVRYYPHTIKSGDTLLALANQYGSSLGMILDANPGVRERFLKPGAVLLIPALKETSPSQEPAQDKGAAFNGTHLVKKGETLWSIALAYHITPETLAEVNNLVLNAILPVGKVLKTPIKE